MSLIRKIVDDPKLTSIAAFSATFKLSRRTGPVVSWHVAWIYVIPRRLLKLLTPKLATRPRRHLHAPQPSPTHAGRPKTRPPMATNASRFQKPVAPNSRRARRRTQHSLRVGPQPGRHPGLALDAPRASPTRAARGQTPAHGSTNASTVRQDPNSRPAAQEAFQGQNGQN